MSSQTFRVCESRQIVILQKNISATTFVHGTQLPEIMDITVSEFPSSKFYIRPVTYYLHSIMHKSHCDTVSVGPSRTDLNSCTIAKTITHKMLRHNQNVYIA